jgi:DNA-binding phage protein
MAQTQYKNADDIDSEYRIFSQILVLLWNTHGQAAMRELAHASGVGESTLYSWKLGTTMTPRIDTLTKVAKALGYEIVLKRTRRAPIRAVR